MPGELISVAELARLTKIDRTTWYRWIRQGICPLSPLHLNGTVRFRGADVTALLAGQVVQAAPEPESEQSVPATVSPVKRGRGRPRKAEVLAKQRFEQQQAQRKGVHI